MERGVSTFLDSQAGKAEGEQPIKAMGGKQGEREREAGRKAGRQGLQADLDVLGDAGLQRLRDHRQLILLVGRLREALEG
jgi:hypothetical protein